MADTTRNQAARPGPGWPRRLGAALTALWYLLVYTHLASLALARIGPVEGGQGCSCAGMASGGSCGCVSRGANADACGLAGEPMGCRGPRTAPASCLFAAPCADELPATPQTDNLTWPHLAACACGFAPRLSSTGLDLPRLSASFSLASAPPEQVPKTHA